MLTRSRGLTLPEILLTLLVLGIVASFTIPKVFHSSAQDHKEKAMVRESFAMIGEAYIGRLNDHTLPDATIDGSGAEAERFGDYLFSKLKYLTTTITDPSITNNYCGAEADYYVMPDGVVIRNICEATAPNRLEVTVFVPGSGSSNNDVKYIMELPEKQERYTTKYQITTTSCDCISVVDPALNTVDACPSPSRNRNIDETCP